ncbi:MAG: glycine cleavage system protein GcvH [Candidatus Omnitrophica bacterium]|nr:glycine cleavage system protein GcvH [Candidatus Omnitrophota bacterium]
MEVLDSYLYTHEHEWIHVEDNVATVGISDYAQNALGDITFTELPEVGGEFEQFEQLASIESVKAATDVYCPMSGKVIEVNSEVVDDPELINRDCYEKGWLIKLEIAAPDEKSKLMKAVEYTNYCENLS